MDKAIEAYLNRAKEIIGHRTSAEAAYDDAVVGALNQGHAIEKALAIAGEKHPDETVEWDNSTMGKHRGQPLTKDKASRETNKLCLHRQITECLRFTPKGFALLKHSTRYALIVGSKRGKIVFGTH